MLTKSKAFLDAEQAGYSPLFYLYADTDYTRRCFTFKDLPTNSGDTGFWDGSGYVGDGLTYGSELGTSQAKALLLSLPNINRTTTQGTRGLLTALSASQVGHLSADLDNLTKQEGKYFFSNIITGENTESFLRQNCELRMGFYGVAYADQLSLFRGRTIDSPLKGPVFSLSADAITSTLYDIWEVPKSSLYTNPAQDNQAIPAIIGDWTENSAIDQDGDGTTDAGPIPLVCIDTVNDVWAMACHALLTTGNGQSISLYDDDGLIDSGDYTYTASNDYESTGTTIAYVTFSTPPTGTVTGAYKGAPDDSGALITNPIEALEKILSIMGETTSFDTTAYQAAVNDADTASYTCAGMIMADNAKAYWMSDLLYSFLGSWFLNENDEIVVQLDTGAANFLDVAGNLDESFFLSPLSLLPSADNLITRPFINYAVSNSKIDRRFKSDANSSYLQTYADDEETNDVASQPLPFNWTRNTATVTTIASRIETLYAPLKIYTVKTQDFSLVNVEPGDFITFGASYLYDDVDGSELTGQVGRVINMTLDCQNKTIDLAFYDTNDFLLAEPDLWDGLGGYVGDGLTYGGERA